MGGRQARQEPARCLAWADTLSRCCQLFLEQGSLLLSKREVPEGGQQGPEPSEGDLVTGQR